MRYLPFLCLLAVAAGPPPGDPRGDFVEVDFARVARSIRKEPRYVAQPRYALFILDPKGEFHAWAVLDKSDAKLPHYDVLYFDKNGDGDLTDLAERFVGKYDNEAKQLSIRVGDLPIPGTKLTHTDVRFMTVEPHGYKGFWMEMKWAGEVHVDGGYRTDSELTAYAASAAEAPVLRPTPLGTLSFKCWHEDLTLTAGKSANVQVSLGNPGSGADTFCPVSEHFLAEGKDVIVATLIARDRDGKELRLGTEFRKHC